MAPNKRGGPLSSECHPDKRMSADNNNNIITSFQPPSGEWPPDTRLGGDRSVVGDDAVAARGPGTRELGDTYAPDRFWASETRTFFTGLMFLTRLPCPHWTDHHPCFLMRSMLYFPVLGAIVGGWGFAFYDAAQVLFNSHIAAAASVGATVWLTGCFHEDGLADSFDGFGGGWGRLQILRIMKDSRVGTYALVAMCLTLFIKLHAIAALPRGLVFQAMVTAHTVSRWTCIPLTYSYPYLQDEDDAKKGLYDAFAAARPLLTAFRVACGSLAAGVIAVTALGWILAARVIALTIVITIASGLYGNAILGGMVGDYLGATIQVAEVGVYLVLAADWDKLTSAQCWRPLGTLAAVAILPAIYCRKIIDFGAAC